MSKKYDYDAIIIGAGIGGLTCGCYLAKAGMKVLLVEKNIYPGGCCSSFKRNGLTFDIGAFSLGDCKVGGNLRSIIDELDLKKKIDLRRMNPAEIILTPYNNITIKNNVEDIIEEFQNNFPEESYRIEKFFNFLNDSSPRVLFVKLKEYSFKEWLNILFKNQKLKLVLNTIMVTFGQSSDTLSAVTAAIVLKEFILDGGYHAKGGMLGFAEGLVKTLRQSGGEVRFSCEVKKIVVAGRTVEGVVLGKDIFVSSKFIISNCDATNTFSGLVGKEYFGSNFISKIQKLTPSISALMVFLGVKNEIKKFGYGYKYWCALNPKIDDVISSVGRGDFRRFGDHLLISFPSFCDPKLAPVNRESVCVLVSAPFMDKKFWRKNAAKLSARVIKKVEKIIPEVRNRIFFKEVATPLTYYNFTKNRRGAAYGWAASPSQVTKNLIRYDTPVKRLYLVGHWTNNGFGVSRVASSGRSVSKLVLESCKK